MLCSEKPCDSRYSSQRSSVHFATYPGHCCFLGTCLLNGGVLGPTCCPSGRAGQRPGDLAPHGPLGPPPPPEPNTAPVRFTESPSGYRAGVPPGRAVGPGTRAHACPGRAPCSQEDPAMFHKLLVANRGEIASRALRAAHECGARTVAVSPHEDRNSLLRLKA